MTAKRLSEVACVEMENNEGHVKKSRSQKDRAPTDARRDSQGRTACHDDYEKEEDRQDGISARRTRHLEQAAPPFNTTVPEDFSSDGVRVEKVDKEQCNSYKIKQLLQKQG